MEFQTAYGSKIKDQIQCSESLTKQSPKEECDVNNIVRKYQSHGIYTVNPITPHYGDYFDGADFQRAQGYLVEAQNAFDDLPSKVRARFRNDPAYFFDFVNDPNNADELVSLGLAVKTTAPAAPEIPVGDEGATVPPGGDV